MWFIPSSLRGSYQVGSQAPGQSLQMLLSSGAKHITRRAGDEIVGPGVGWGGVCGVEKARVPSTVGHSLQPAEIWEFESSIVS